MGEYSMINKKYLTNRLLLVQSTPELSQLVTNYYEKNREFLELTEPKRNNDFYTEQYQMSILELDEMQSKNDEAYKFWIFKKNNVSEIIGCIGFSNIVRGPFQSCFLGYKLDEENRRCGYMTEALNKCIRIAFDEIKLHRIEANIMPRNIPSLKVASKLGFENEGLSKEYLNINGVWEDHIHMVLINKNYK